MSEEIPQSITGITRIIEQAGRLGIEGVDDITKFADTMARLGVTTTMTADEASRVMAGFAAVVGMPIDEVDRLGSALSLLGNNVSVNEGVIMNFAHRVGSAGAAANLTASEILGLSAGLAHLQLPAEMGGSAVSRVLNEMVLAVETGSSRLEDFGRVAGMSAEQFARSFRNDAMDALLLFFSGLDDFERHGSSVVSMLDELGFNNLRVADTMRRAALSGDHLRNTVEMSTRAFEENTSLMRESEILFSTTESQMQLLENATMRLRVSIGDALTPALNELARGLTGSTNSMTEFVTQNEWLVQGITILTLAMGAGISTLAAYTAAIKVLQVAKTALAAATGSANVALMASPIGAVAKAVTALVVVIGTFTMAQARANERRAEAIRLAEEEAIVNRANAQAIQEQISAFEELERRRANSSGPEETRQINKEILELERSIVEVVGIRADTLDLVNGRYEDQLELIRQIEIEENRKVVRDAQAALERERAYAETRATCN